MPLFTMPLTSLVEDQGWWAFWREGPVIGVRIIGPLTDEKNPVWRARLDEHMAEVGYPALGELDVRGATPAASTPNRVKTAMWCRKVLTHIPRVLILTRPEHDVTFAIKIILRVAGMSNAEIVHDAALVEEVLDRHLAAKGQA